ncbi:hypothetical protein PC129_g17199 [Phytophthora cactorum]|uniref:Reverse transcriptase Ty1/copia-type domain-containing protein n=1 Tax=Phytophthora cactorum TaxID=29920 RepID=A0A329RKF4_9STRA|nr:hypothetical protein Pcac1_g2790 [Phytophthora cactorum]KAG2885081.1 hypothetical protein PC114_g19850 [Phytophthora cactorum]KAG2909594.1 hypothetical protein PC117_g19614 [Phytophthora cactorum]KAG3013280.1 hypothetical protein PC120_g13378 [Phytophthora cactorum]KAG3139362.1 hypothetical protein C6341_g20397 [Phytophthora cactorum]
MSECRPRKTPLDQGMSLYRRSEGEDEAVEVPYRQAVGALLYLTRVTRPDIAFTVNQVAAHASSPSRSHWNAVKNIMRYIEGTRSMGLIYRRSESAVPVRLYTDGDWANNEEDRRSVSGTLVQVFGNAVPWQTKRQRLVSKSSTIAEYIAADDGVEEALWTRLLLQNLMKTQNLPAIPAILDNKSTIKRLTNGKSSEAQKSVDCRFFSIRDAVSSGDLQLEYCPTAVMLAGGLTKALGTTRFRELRTAIGIHEVSTSRHDIKPSAGGEVLRLPA